MFVMHKGNWKGERLEVGEPKSLQKFSEEKTQQGMN